MSLWDDTDCIDTGTYTVRRRAAGTFVKGRYVREPEVPFETVATIYPAGGRQLLLLEEGLRGNETMTMLTPVEMYTQDSSPGQDPDIVEFRGEDYCVVRVSRWEDDICDTDDVFYECLISRIPAP